MKKIKRIIMMLILIFILIIITLLFLLSKSNNEIKGNQINNKLIDTNQVKNNQVSNIIEDMSGYTDIENPIISDSIYNKLEYIKSSQSYFTIQTITSNYINLIGNNMSNKLVEILDVDYIETYKLNEENVMSIFNNIPKLEKINEYYKVLITEMLTAKVDESHEIYIVKGKGRIVGRDSSFNINILIKINSQNLTYSIYHDNYLSDNNIDKLKDGDKIEISNLNKQESKKTFAYINGEELDLAKEYFNNYKEMINYYPEEAYYQLDKQYAQKRFSGSIMNFEKYIEENKEILNLMIIDKYKVITNSNETYYVCADQYNKLYIFKQQDGIMRYSAYLDNYTVMIEDEIRKYNEYNDVDKAKYNLTKFINMLNTKDYNSIYKHLNDIFKQNNFKDLETLKEYIKENMYELNSIEITELDNESYDYYVFECKVINIRNINEQKEMTVIIDQKEGLDFNMSFSIK